MLKKETLLKGESYVQGAPTIQLSNGSTCTPQHYLLFEHNQQSVEEIIFKIQYSSNFIIFVDQDEQSIYLQVGIIGKENYQRNKANRSDKIVYGRKWRIEKNLPSSEVIQAAFLALKKAKEHELREMLTLVDMETEKISTPFNSHHDLPLMALYKLELQECQQRNGSKKCLKSILKRLQFDYKEILLKNIKQHHDLWILDFQLLSIPKNKKFEINLKEFKDLKFTILCKSLDYNEVLYELMDTLIKVSDREVEENFYYDHFLRFSRKTDLQQIGKFSIETRQNKVLKNRQPLKTKLKKVNYQIDQTRVPCLSSSHLSQKIQKTLKEFSINEGILPKIKT
ncbi:hypothetical protein MJH12_06110 [bacterium]|nr:hypothetical protein [bacterium]